MRFGSGEPTRRSRPARSHIRAVRRRGRPSRTDRRPSTSPPARRRRVHRSDRPSAAPACRRRSASTPPTAATAATIDPPPGSSPVGVGNVVSRFVPMSRAPSSTARPATRSRRIVEVAMESDDDGVDRMIEVGTGVRQHRCAASSRRPRTLPFRPSRGPVRPDRRGTPPPSRTRRHHRWHRSRCARVRASCSSRVAAELFVTNSTRRPEARIAAIASTEPGIGRWASQTTPSRSHSTWEIRRGIL